MSQRSEVRSQKSDIGIPNPSFPSLPPVKNSFWLRAPVLQSWFLIVACFVGALALAAAFLGTLALILIAFVAEPLKSIVTVLIIVALIAIFRP